MSSSQAKLNSYLTSKAKTERHCKLNNLRHAALLSTLEWRLPIETFLLRLSACHNYYSILLTLFDIADEPQWRNKVPHLTALIQALHNGCYHDNGSYLSGLHIITNYEEKLYRLLYLNDTRVQCHLKLLLEIYLANNTIYHIINEQELSGHLLNVARRYPNTKEDYLWLLTQIKISNDCAKKVVGILEEGRENNVETNLRIIIAGFTILDNYVVDEQQIVNIEELISCNKFLEGICWGLTAQSEDVQREALLLVNNLIAKDGKLAIIVLENGNIMEKVESCRGSERQLFEELKKLRQVKVSDDRI